MLFLYVLSMQNNATIDFQINQKTFNYFSFHLQGDIFSGLNDGILSRAEALADIGKHQSSHVQMSSQLKHDVMYHHSMGAPPQRPLQVCSFSHSINFPNFYINLD